MGMRGGWRTGALLLTLLPWLVCAETSVSKMPTTTLQTAVSPPQKTPLIVPPSISGFSPIGCYAKGARFMIIGQGFGASQGARSAGLRGKGVSIPLIVEGWSDSRIRARIPDDPLIGPGQWYSVGIAATDHGQWLTPLDHNLQICETTSLPQSGATSKKALSASQTALPPAVGQSAIKQTESTPEIPGMPSVTPAETGSGDAPAPPRGAGGSLFGQGLPTPPAITAYTDEPADDEQSEADELLIISPDLPQALQVQQLGQGLGLAIKRRSVLKGLGLVVSVFRVPAGTRPLQLVRQLRAQSPELWIDLNHRLTLQGGEEARRYPQRMLAWPQATLDCGRGVRIGLVDGPLPENHPLLAAAAIERQSFVTHGVTPAPSDHALAIAAILVGGEGRGLTPAAALYVAEVMRQRDEDHVDTSVDRLLQGLDWLAGKPVDLINLSLGGPYNLILDAAIQRLQALGILVVAAAGNQGPAGPPVYPAATPGVIAVTAIDADRRRYREANQGDYIAFAAPGVDLWVPVGNGDAYLSGTSYATPYVTALLAVLRQQGPQAAWEAHLQTLIDTAEDLGAPGRDREFGYGLPRAQRSCGDG